MRSSSLKPLRYAVFVLFSLSLLAAGGYWLFSWRWDLVSEQRRFQSRIQHALKEPLAKGEFPATLRFARPGGSYAHLAKYTINPEWQRRMDALFQLWKPDYSAFVALDATTGAVLTLSSFSKAEPNIGNLAVRATFPAASVFKIVTAAAALNESILDPESLVSFNGRRHTLYKRNVTARDMNRWTRTIPFKKAFALSINTVFGKLGMFQLKGETLEQYALRFFFNQTIPGDLPLERASFHLKNNNPWSWAEIASGFNRVVLMSPVQGALMAAAIANDGVAMEPHLVESLFPVSGESLAYAAKTREIGSVVSPESAEMLRVLMRETVRNGTARFAFKRNTRLKERDIGGKTGSLKGTDPEGKCDWFVGYGRDGERRVAIAALTVDVKKWRIKASKIASHFFEAYFAD
ncbi:MAG: penicillin-binding protein [Bdellovibrionales bacterium]|nr:penicillin-binding protein [Bdellovibrionales bacterium]